MKTYLITVQSTVRATADDDVSLADASAAVVADIRKNGCNVVDRVVATREFTGSDTLLLFAEAPGSIN